MQVKARRAGGHLTRQYTRSGVATEKQQPASKELSKGASTRTCVAVSSGTTPSTFSVGRPDFW